MYFLLYACKPAAVNTESAEVDFKDSEQIKYARGFTIKEFKDYTQVVVRNPWDTTKVLETYLLIARESRLPDNLPPGTVVRIPVQRVGLCSSIFAGVYSQLNALAKVVAVSDPDYFNFKEIRDGVQSGTISDLGLASSLNTEMVLASQLDILVVSPFEVSTTDRLKDFGINVVSNASYMEVSPLGRTEWIKFDAAFLGKLREATKLFDAIEERYLKLSAIIPNNRIRPTVIAEKKYGDTWYISGGDSYMAQFYKHAGADYVFAHLRHTGSIPMSFENVFKKSINADFWLIKYHNTTKNLTLKELGEEYDLYKRFDAFSTGNIYGLNSGLTPYYERGQLEPDVVLSDLVAIFHPDLLPGYTPVYFKKLHSK